MFIDPIVAEARRAGKDLEDEAGGDIAKFFEILRRAEEQYRGRLVDRVSRTPDAERPAHRETGMPAIG